MGDSRQAQVEIRVVNQHHEIGALFLEKARQLAEDAPDDAQFFQHFHHADDRQFIAAAEQRDAFGLEIRPADARNLRVRQPPLDGAN